MELQVVVVSVNVAVTVVFPADAGVRSAVDPLPVLVIVPFDVDHVQSPFPVIGEPPCVYPCAENLIGAFPISGLDVLVTVID